MKSIPVLAVVWFGFSHKPCEAMEADRKLYAKQPTDLLYFHGKITGIDRVFGRLRSRFPEMRIHENTILWYLNDNVALSQVGFVGTRRGKKGEIYEGGQLVPAILAWPARIWTPRIASVRSNICNPHGKRLRRSYDHDRWRLEAEPDQ